MNTMNENGILASKFINNKNILFRKLESAEKWDKVSCICLEKIYTVENIPQINYLWYDLQLKKNDSLDEDFLNSENVFSEMDPTFKNMTKSAILGIDQNDHLIGTSLSMTFNFFVGYSDLNSMTSKYQISPDEDSIISFNSVRKFSGIVRKNLDDNRYFVSVIGASEIMLPKCSKYMFNGVEKDIDDNFLQALNSAFEKLSHSQRVLLIASMERDSSPENGWINELEGKNLTFIGLVAFQYNSRYLDFNLI